MEKPQELIANSFKISSKVEPTVGTFEETVVQAINEIFSALGESVSKAIYSHLKSGYGINENEIPQKIEEFAHAIEETFGMAGALIEIKIIERLHSKYGDFHFAPINGELDFVAYMTKLRNRL